MRATHNSSKQISDQKKTEFYNGKIPKKNYLNVFEFFHHKIYIENSEWIFLQVLLPYRCFFSPFDLKIDGHYRNQQIF